MENNLIIHTIIHNENDTLKIENIINKNNKNIKKQEKKLLFNIEIKMWNEKEIINLISKSKLFSKHLHYYKQLIINKSKENFAKYIILYEHGGVFVNNILLQYNNNYIYLCEYIKDINKNIIFFEENISLKIETSLLDKDINLINDDIIYISNKENQLMKYILEKIDYNKIPKNQYQTKLNLGSYFLTNQINNFYLKNNESIDEITINYIIDIKHPINIDKYREELYPNIFDLIDPTKEFNKYSYINDMANYISIFGLLLFYLLGRWNLIILYLIIAAVGIYLAKYYIYSLVNGEIKKAEIDNKYFYDYRKNKFKIFDELKKNVNIIKSEAEYILKHAPKLDIHRNYDDWHNSENYVNKIKNEYGWIRSWSYKDGEAIKSEGNYNWLNYGLLYFNNEFEKNCEKCPKTLELLNKIKDKINICGFSYFMGNTTIEIHSDETGPSNNSMAMHLGLIIPKNPETCKLIMKIDNEFYYESEKEGKILIFDATNEHYAYNQSNEDRVVLYIDFKY
jgi:hypothetical protein